MKTFSIVSAFTKSNRGIGFKNRLPWRIREDMEWFKNLTIGGTVIMGRNTWESIPEKFKPLSHRINVIITSKKYHHDIDNNTYYFKSLDEALSFNYNFETAIIENNQIYVIGGSQLYNEAINHDTIAIHL